MFLVVCLTKNHLSHVNYFEFIYDFGMIFILNNPIYIHIYINIM